MTTRDLTGGPNQASLLQGEFTGGPTTTRERSLERKDNQGEEKVDDLNNQEEFIEEEHQGPIFDLTNQANEQH